MSRRSGSTEPIVGDDSDPVQLIPMEDDILRRTRAQVDKKRFVRTSFEGQANN
jgi:hypothetical protein